jgi:hypothetical protein
MSLPRGVKYAVLLVPVVALCVLPAAWHFMFQPSWRVMAVVSAAAVAGLLMYPVLLMSWHGSSMRRWWRDLRYRWLTRNAGRKAR